MRANRWTEVDYVRTAGGHHLQILLGDARSEEKASFPCARSRSASSRRRWVWVWAWLFIVCDGMMNSVDGRCGVRTSRSRRTCMYSSTAICLTLAIKHTHTKSAMIGTFFFSFDFFPPARTPDGLRTVAPPREDSCHTVSKMSDVSDTACLDGRKSLQIKGDHDQPTDHVSQCHVCESRRG